MLSKAREIDNLTIPGISIDRFSQLLALIYDGALEADRWSRCLEELRREFKSNYVSLIVRPGTSSDLGLIVSAAGERKVMPHNPMIAASPFAGLPPDRVVTESDILSESEWRASAYYRDWCQPVGVFHVMATDIATRDGGIYGMRFTRPENDPAFGPAERAVWERLLPHVKRALNLRQGINQDKRVNSVYSQAMGQLMVGVIVLDEHGQVVECNAMGAAILQANDGLRTSSGQLEASYPTDNRKLQRLIRDVLVPAAHREVAVTEAMSITRPSGKVNWGLVVQAITPDEWTEGKHRPCVAVFVRDAEGKSYPPVRLAQQLFQLTPAETALAIELANGLSLEEAAEALNIRRNTARAHLRSIFSKTGVRRQTELVRIFLNSVALLGTSE